MLHACMHGMQRGNRLACMRVWVGQLSQRSYWQPNMAEWRHDAGLPGPSTGHKTPCLSNGHHVFSAKQLIHQKSPTPHRRYWAVSSSALWWFTHMKTPHNLVYLLIFVFINKLRRTHQNCNRSMLHHCRSIPEELSTPRPGTLVRAFRETSYYLPIYREPKSHN